MRIGGVPATVEMRRNSGDADAETAPAGDARRCGAQPARLGYRRQPDRPGRDQGRRAHRFGGEQENRLAVEADFTQAKIDNLLPGWVKTPNRPARATLHLCRQGQGGPARRHRLRRRRRLDPGQRRVRRQWRFRSPPISRCSECPTATRPPAGRAHAGQPLQGHHARRRLRRARLRQILDGRRIEQRIQAARPGIDIDLDAKVGAVVGPQGRGRCAISTCT